MDRRTFLAGVAGAAALSACGSSSSTRRPNMLLIMADDMRADEARFLPAVRRLAEGGATYVACRANVAVCSPARAGLLSGMWSDRHGVVDQYGSLQDYDATLGPWMAAAGYRTGLLGRFFTPVHAQRAKPGWEHWRALVGDDLASHGYGVTDGRTVSHPKAHVDEWLADATVAFIEDHDDRPWFAWVNPNSPHWPYQPLPVHRNGYSDVEWPIVDGGVETKPSWVRKRPKLTAAQVRETRQWQQVRLQELLGVDDLVRRSVQAIADAGQADDTLVVFTSDNGNAVGDRRLANGVHKNQPYDECLRVPLILNGLGFKGSVATACCQQDITATLLDQAGARRRALDGVPLDRLPADRAVLHHRKGAGGTDGPIGNGLTTTARKLWRHEAEGEDRYELYDLESDPGELVNLANERAWQTERDRLDARLDSILAR